MIGYYMTNDRNGFREKFYVPLNFLASSDDGNEFHIVLDVNRIKRLKSKTNRSKLERNGWEIYEVEIQDEYIKRLHDICFSRNQSKYKIKKLTDHIIFSSIELLQSKEDNSND